MVFMLAIVVVAIVVLMFTVPSTHARIGGEQLARKGVVLEMKPPRPLMFEDLEIQLPEIPVVEMCLSQSVSIAAIPRVGRTALHGLLVTHHLRRRRRGWWGPVGTRFHAQRACRQGAANKDQHRDMLHRGFLYPLRGATLQRHRGAATEQMDVGNIPDLMRSELHWSRFEWQMGVAPSTAKNSVLRGLMKLLQTHHLSDGKGLNQGQAASLIEIESPADFDTLLENIVRTGYYDRDYFASHSGYEPGRLITHFLFVAEMAMRLRPRRLLEVGCGRGDVLSLLRRRGISVSGIDFSAAAKSQAWPNIRDAIELGDLTDVCARYAAGDRRFDVVCGFDIWEHLHPERLSPSIRAVVDASTDDALYFFVVPAFGEDPGFGESFPLEFEENRTEFQARVPFRRLKAEQIDPPIPASGHLIWAHTDWWEQQFQSHGLQRRPELERRLHFFDRFLPYSVRSFYIFARMTEAATRRARALEEEKVHPFDLVRMFARHPREIGSHVAIDFLRKRLPAPMRSRLKRLLRRSNTG